VADGRAFHLPDLPISDHPSTHRERRLHDETQEFMRQIERTRPRLLAIVIEGRSVWRKRARSVWRGLRIEDDILDSLFDYMCLQALPPKAQRAWLDRPGKRADIVRAFIPKLEREQEQLKLIAKWAP